MLAVLRLGRWLMWMLLALIALPGGLLLWFLWLDRIYRRPRPESPGPIYARGGKREEFATIEDFNEMVDYVVKKTQDELRKQGLIE